MLRPSYAELMDVLNKDTEGSNVKSRYTVVIAAAKRARQLTEGHEPLIDESEIKVDKPMSIAVQEMYKGKIEVVPEGQGTVLKLKKPVVEEEIKPEEDDDLDDEFDDEAEDGDFDEDDESFGDEDEDLIASITKSLLDEETVEGEE
ncbi:MAG: DNA-directed RNA polymerase subunit omega [Firmicutes bacterium]|nr:DNA-directed RNA polymerase subunit omega [Bacillota bacterium]